MTVDSIENKINHSPDGINDTFSYDFLVLNKDHMKIYEDGVLADPVPSFSMTGLGEQVGGDIIFDTPPASSITTLTLKREVPLTQETDYPPYGPFPAESHEAALDKLTLICQQLMEEIGRKVGAPVDGGSVDYTLPDYSAGEFWKWDESTQSIVTATLAMIGAISIGLTAGDVVQLIDDGAGGAKFPSSLALRSLVEDTTPELGGTLDCLSNTVKNGVFKNMAERSQTVEFSGSTAIDLSNGLFIVGTVTADATLSFSGASGSDRAIVVVLEITNGGAHTVTWPASVEWATGVAPELQASGVDVIVLYTTDNGTTWRALRSWAEA